MLGAWNVLRKGLLELAEGRQNPPVYILAQAETVHDTATHVHKKGQSDPSSTDRSFSSIFQSVSNILPSQRMVSLTFTHQNQPHWATQNKVP